jgi:predicted outer membrane lipoprotein
MLRGFLLASAIGILGGIALETVPAADNPVPGVAGYSH